VCGRIHGCCVGRPPICCLHMRGNLVQERHGNLSPGRSGHQLADTNVVDSKWCLLISTTALYSLGLQRHFRLLTSLAKRYWLSGEEGGAYLSVQRDIFQPPGPNYPHPYARCGDAECQTLQSLRVGLVLEVCFRFLCFCLMCLSKHSLSKLNVSTDTV